MKPSALTIAQKRGALEAIGLHCDHVNDAAVDALWLHTLRQPGAGNQAIRAARQIIAAEGDRAR